MALKIIQNTSEELVITRTSWGSLIIGLLISLISLFLIIFTPVETIFRCEGGISEGTCEYTYTRLFAGDTYLKFPASELQKARLRSPESELQYKPVLELLDYLNESEAVPGIPDTRFWQQNYRAGVLKEFRDGSRDRFFLVISEDWFLDLLTPLFFLMLGFFLLGISRFGTIRFVRSGNWCSIDFRGITGKYVREFSLDEIDEIKWQYLGTNFAAGRPVLFVQTGTPINFSSGYHSTNSVAWQVYSATDDFLKARPEPGKEAPTGPADPQEINPNADAW